MEDINLLKILKQHTFSFCPKCLAPVPARVMTSADGKVYMERTCSQHGSITSMIERDLEFYKEAVRPSRRLMSPSHRYYTPTLVIFPTYRCNLNCRICYVPRRDSSMDLNFKELEDILDRWPYPNISFAGGEPTVVEQLPEFLSMARSKGKRPFIVTNGVKLANRKYTADLAKNGLYGVWLSLNALDGRVLEETDGKDLLEVKMKAVANIKRYIHRLSICFTLHPGLNDDQLEKVLFFSISQYPFVRMFHVEHLSKIGRGSHSKDVYLSELLSAVAEAINVKRTDMIELADKKAASFGLYSYEMDYRDIFLKAFRKKAKSHRNPGRPAATLLREVGLFRALTLLLSSLARIKQMGMLIRVFAGPEPDTVDLRETWNASRTITVSKESPFLELWEYFIRYHGIKS